MNSCLNELQAMQLRRLLETGLPLAARPYQRLAEQIGSVEEHVLQQIQRWQEEGLFRRVGLVLKHRALGFRANAMLVMDIPDAQVDEIGRPWPGGRGEPLLSASAVSTAVAIQPVLHGPRARA